MYSVFRIWYGDGAGNTVEESNLAFYPESEYSRCHQQGHVGSKTLPQQNALVLSWRCWLTQVVLYNGHKMAEVVIFSFSITSQRALCMWCDDSLRRSGRRARRTCRGRRSARSCRRWMPRPLRWWRWRPLELTIQTTLPLARLYRPCELSLAW